LARLADNAAPFERVPVNNGKLAVRPATCYVETTSDDCAGAEKESENKKSTLQNVLIEIAG
jgi:hypothetical protein